MRCTKHKTYKGIKPTKRDCPDCKRLYKQVQAKFREELSPTAPYRSITTRDKRVSLPAILAEISCLMLFGRQPPYFWRKKGPVARHYDKILREIKHWQKRNKAQFKGIHAIFYHTYTKYYQDILAEELSRRKVEEPEAVDEDDFEEDIDEVDFDVERRARLKRLGLSQLEETDEEDQDEEEEEEEDDWD